MFIKRLLLSLIIFLPGYVLAQTDIFERMDSTFNARVRAMDDDLDRYTRQMDEDFASYLARSWERFPMAEVETDRFDEKANFVNVSFPPPVKYPAYSPVKGARYEKKNIPFFGKQVSLDVDVKTRFTMFSVSEMQVSRAWKRLITTSFSTIIERCENIRTELQLNDWGVYLFISQLTDKIFDDKQVNEKKVFMAFILTHAGYNVKLGRSGKGTGREARLHLLLPFAMDVNEWKTEIDGKKYYTWSHVKDKKMNNIYQTNILSYRKNLKLAKADIDLAIKQPPAFSSDITRKTIKSASQYLQEVRVAWQNALTDYYDTYPNTVLSVYLNTPLSPDTKQILQKSFQPALDKMSKSGFAGELLFWLYHALDYKLDEEEIALFSEQTLKSRYNDCEDRAILFARIMKEIVGLDVVLIVFEGGKGKISHVATGVNFREETEGISIIHNGKQYTICDPSDKRCIIGSTLDEYRNSEHKIIELIN